MRTLFTSSYLSYRPLIRHRSVFPYTQLHPYTTQPDTTPESHKYDFDLIVVGGGSGGLAAAKEAAEFDKKVAVCDFVTPSETRGSRWGLGGTCVNVGCIPKKLMHQASLLKESIEDAAHFGWSVDPKQSKLNWETLVNEVQSHIKSLNFGYRSQLKSANVKYFNEMATFLGPHTIQTKNQKGQVSIKTARRFLVAVGGRPLLPSIPGVEHVISSDDIFSLPTPPGKTLVVGASYVALECAGFLNSFGYDTTLMVRSILLRGFDQQMADLIGDYMKEQGVKFIKPAVPTSLKKLEDSKLQVTFKMEDKEETDTFDTVLVAIGRQASTATLGLDKLGIKLGTLNKIHANDHDQTTLSHIYAIGDCVVGRPELTPTAIQAGRLWARRIYNSKTKLLDYNYVPTTVFTPLEYGTIGLSEEAAIDRFGPENVEVYHAYFQPIEQTIPHRLENKCYAKLICNKLDQLRVVGFHLLSPSAGEIVQGFATAMRLGATKDDFDDTIGVHPVIAENMTLLNITKSSGKSAIKTGC